VGEAEATEAGLRGEGAKEEEPEAREAKGENAEPAALSVVPGGMREERREARGRSGAGDDEEGARGEGGETVGADHGRASQEREKAKEPPPAMGAKEPEPGARAKRVSAPTAAPLDRLRRRRTARPEKPGAEEGSSILRSLASPSMHWRRASRPRSSRRRRERGSSSPLLARMGTAREKPAPIASRAREAPPSRSAAREAVVWMPASLIARRPERPNTGAFA